MNNTCHRPWFCFSPKSLSINSSTSIDETLEDYCETNLDEILHLKRTYSLDKSPRKMKQSRSNGFIQKTKTRHKKRSCCLTEFCNATKRNIREKRPLTLTQQILAPIVTLKDLISSSSSENESLRPVVVSLSAHSLEECVYCSSESALSIKTDPNNNHFDETSIHSLNLRHSVELYLSSNTSLNEQFDLSSISSEQYASIKETKQLSLCEINEIIYAIHSDIDDDGERNETIDSLALALRDVAEEIPVARNEPEQQPPGLGQIVVRAVMYEIVMRLFSFYLLILVCCVRFT